MEDIKHIQKDLVQANFTFFETKEWEQLVYVWADYCYGPQKSVLAKYLFLYTDKNGWSFLLEQGDKFASDVIEPMYYSLDSDLRWNLYFICIVDDEDLIKIDRYQKRNFENNTQYTRNFLIPKSQVKHRIPVGRVVLKTTPDKVLHPADEWRKALYKYPLCLEKFSEQALEDYVSGKSQTQARQFSAHKAVNPVHIRSLLKIQIPVTFRPHFYPKDWSLPCGKFNLLFGANGTGKTSVLASVELAVTGTICKPPKYAEDDIEQTDVIIETEGSAGLFQLERPRTASQRARRETEWYSYDSSVSSGGQLNSLFHRFNYFSIDDPYRVTNVSPEMDQVFSGLLFGTETSKIWKNIQDYRLACGQKQKELADKYMALRTQMLQPPPEVETIFEDSIRTYITKHDILEPSLLSDTKLQDISKIISKIHKSLRPLLEYTVIPNQSYTEARLEELPQEQEKNNRLMQKQERKINRLNQKLNFTLFPSISEPWLSERIAKLRTEKDRREDTAAELRTEKEMLLKAHIFWNNTAKWITQPDQNISVSYLEGFCQETENMIQEFRQFQSYIDKYTRLDVEFRNMTAKLKACKKLYAVLSKLSPPEDYAKNFIETNLSQITRIFVNLHMPQEFSDLKMKNGEIVGIRSGESVPLANMSTGQRTALMFSVFFQLNLSNPSAPQFVLIDEPVANIDDLNALLLMDFLRELVITHEKQLFVTTANRNVAMLFRRKFSFLNDALYETSFYRESKDLLQIIQRKYDQRQLLSESDL